MGRWSVTRLRWEALRQYRRYGWFALVVPAILFAAAGAAWQAARLDREAHRVTSEFAAGRTQQPAEKLDSTDSLQRFYDSMPREGDRFVFVKAILGAADAHRVMPMSADYRMHREARTRLVRYQLTLPVEGRWEDIQEFFRAVLAQNRSAVIDNLSLKRGGKDSAQVDGRVRISVLMRRETDAKTSQETASEGRR